MGDTIYVYTTCRRYTILLEYASQVNQIKEDSQSLVSQLKAKYIGYKKTLKHIHVLYNTCTYKIQVNNSNRYTVPCLVQLAWQTSFCIGVGHGHLLNLF